MAAIHLGLTQAQIEHARNSGGLTFRPVRGNRMVCNQAPGLGHISSRQADSLRSQVWPRQAKLRTAKVRIRRTPGTYKNNYQASTSAYCPASGHLFNEVCVGQLIKCPCGLPIKVTA